MSLAFPTDAQYQDYRIDTGSAAGYTNDESEADTPFSANIHDDLVIDPALLAESNAQGSLHPPYQVPHPLPIFPENHVPQPLPPHHPPYPLGPSGDPYVNPAQNTVYSPANHYQQDNEPFIYLQNGFYPPHEPPYPPTPLQPDHHPPNHQQPSKPPVPPKPTKRKRKKVPPREENCSFCGGSDAQNKLGEGELMVSCVNCGRSGHPSCLQIPEISDIIRNYDWKCIECKTCETCKGKGDDTCLLFCDQCDRGWHSYCLKPPLPGPPSGSWACPTCIPMPAEGSSTTRRSSSIASSSQYLKKEQEPEVVTSRSRRKGKAKEVFEDAIPEPENIEPVTSSNRERSRKSRLPRVANGLVGQAPLLIPSPPPVPPPPLPLSPTRSATQRVKGKTALDDMMENGHTIARVRLRLTSIKKGKGKVKDHQENGDVEADEEMGPFEGILNDAEADISKTNITTEDKNRYERSRVHAEAKLQPPPIPPHNTGSDSTQSTNMGSGGASESTPLVLPSRPLRSLSLHSPHPNASSMSTPKLPTGKGKGKGPPPAVPDTHVPSPPLRIRSIRFGDFEIDTWFDAPFPEEYTSVADGTLWICEFCLKYMKSRFSASRHRLKCKARHPPGDEIYRDDTVSIFEVDGRKNKIYCQNLCLLSKMFLDHKSLFYDVEPFLFYVMTETDERGARFVGYFSKEKRSVKDYNLSCIMTLPVRQRKGWGNLLIDFSYLLSKLEGRVGGPETPLSALGAISYHRYWTLTLMYHFQTATEPVTLSRISAETSITRQDILATLEKQGIITIYDDPRQRHSHKTPKPRGRPPKHSSNGGIARRNLTRPNTENGTAEESGVEDPSTSWLPRKYYIKWDHDAVKKYISDWEKRGYLRLRPERLKWSPFVLARTQTMSGVEFAGGSGNENASVETMLKIAETEEAEMSIDIAQRQAKAQGLDEQSLLQDDTPARSTRNRMSVGRARSLLAGRGEGHSTPGPESRFLRSRSTRELGETSSRASRSRGQSRATSFSGDEQDDHEGFVGRPQRRLRTRASLGATSRTTTLSALQKRKRDSGNTTQEEESDDIEIDHKRIRKRLSRGRSFAPQETEDTTDLESIVVEDKAQRSLRSSRPTTRPNGLQARTSRKSSTPMRIPRKRQRVDSSPEPEQTSRHSPPAPSTINRPRRVPSSPDEKLPSEEALVTPKSTVTPRHLRSGNGVHTTNARVESRTPRGRPRAANGTFSSRGKSKNTPNSPDICPLNVKSDGVDKVNSLRQLTIDEDLPPSDGVEDQPAPSDAKLPALVLEPSSAFSDTPAPVPNGVDPLTLLAYAATDSLGAATATDDDQDAEGEVEEEIELEDADADGETDEGEEW